MPGLFASSLPWMVALNEYRAARSALSTSRAKTFLPFRNLFFLSGDRFRAAGPERVHGQNRGDCFTHKLRHVFLVILIHAPDRGTLPDELLFRGIDQINVEGALGILNHPG